MKKIFLHIGEHKTGSTAIQTSLENMSDRGLLKEHGFAFVYNPLYILLHSSWNTPNEAQTIDRLVQYLQDFLANTKENTIIISCEGFSSEQFITNHNVEVLYNFLKGYDVKVLVYLRRQDSLLESSFAENCKQIRNKPCLPRWRPRFKNTLDTYAKFFGKNNIQLRIYDRDTLFQNDSVCDFLQWVGLQECVPLREKTYSNPSLSPTNLRIRLSYARQNIMDAKFKEQRLHELQEDAKAFTGPLPWDMIVNFNRARNNINITTAFCNTMNTLLDLENTPKKNTHAYFSPTERQAILDACREENAAIAREYLGREDGILFDESMPKEQVSIDSPTTDDLVASFLPILVHLSQKIDKLEQELKKKDSTEQQKKQSVPQTSIVHEQQLHAMQEKIDALSEQVCKLQKKESKKKAILNIFFQPILKKNAFALVNTCQLDRAETMAQSIIINNPNIAWAYYILGKVQWQRGEHTLALENLERAITLEPKTAYFQKFHASCLKKL